MSYGDGYLERWRMGLLDPRWATLRARRIAIDERSCQGCGSRENLEVHHLTYPPSAKPWEVAIYEIVTLCYGCHSLRKRALTAADETAPRRWLQEGAGLAILSGRAQFARRGGRAYLMMCSPSMPTTVTEEWESLPCDALRVEICIPKGDDHQDSDPTVGDVLSLFGAKIERVEPSAALPAKRTILVDVGPDPVVPTPGPLEGNLRLAVTSLAFEPKVHGLAPGTERAFCGQQCGGGVCRWGLSEDVTCGSCRNTAAYKSVVRAGL